jgi:hypothetical protein
LEGAEGFVGDVELGELVYIMMLLAIHSRLRR